MFPFPYKWGVLFSERSQGVGYSSEVPNVLSVIRKHSEQSAKLTYILRLWELCDAFHLGRVRRNAFCDGRTFSRIRISAT